MESVQGKLLMATFLLLLLSSSVGAQTTITAFLPEVDSYFRLNSNVRLVFQAKGYMEDGGLTHAQIGPSLQFNFRPFEKLKQITIFDLDDIKCMPVVLTIEYRYLPSTTQPSINRLQLIVMFHIPSPGRILVTDRNRADLDYWANGTLNWTYRNRITAERRVTIRSYHPAPYTAAEFAFQSRYSKWSITLFAGCLFPLSKHIQLDSYYEHVNNTSTHPNHQVNAIGAIFQLLLSAV